MSRIRWRFVVYVLFVIALIAAGVVRICADDVVSGTSFLVASLGVFTVTKVLERRRVRQSEESGMVPYDERDESRAGKAALFTLRILLLLLTMTMLIVYAVGLNWEIPVIVPVGIILFLASLLLRVSYWILNRK